MAFRFSKSIKLGKGLKLNLSKRSAGLSIGPKGFKLGVGTRGARVSASIPGTGISYQKQLNMKTSNNFSVSRSAEYLPDANTSNMVDQNQKVKRTSLVAVLLLVYAGIALIITTNVFCVLLGTGLLYFAYRKYQKRKNEQSQLLLNKDSSSYILNDRPIPGNHEFQFVEKEENIGIADEDLKNLDGIRIDQLVGIRYKDANGQISERRVTINTVSDYFDDIRIEALCHERNGHRTFLLSRIERVWDVETGEIIENLGEYLSNLIKGNSQYKFRKIINEHYNEIMALIYLARVDGRMTQPERNVIIEYLRQFDDSVDSVDLDVTIKRMHCKAEQFMTALVEISRFEKTSKEKLITTMNRLAECDNRRDDNEIELIERVKNEIMP